ncbi:MAG TPA: CGNR zinc finger domain-containing protein [Gaiellaceae bacterium]
MVKTDLILDFVNTLDLRPYSEAFETPAQLGAWLEDRGLLAGGARVTKRDLEEAKSVREALRDLMSVQNGLAADVAAANAAIDDASCRAEYMLRFKDGSGRLEATAPGVRGALGRILADVSAAMADGTWPRLKACRAEDCRWAFLDTAKNRSRAWCSMESCGNRAKVQAYRERHLHH